MDPANGPIRVAVVGCGAVTAANLMPVLAGHDRVVVTTLVDRSRERAQALASAYGVPTVLTDAAALSRANVDAVVIATPPAHHAPATIALASQGFHVLVEKPMATTAADAQAMVDAADQAKVALSVGLYRRFLPSVQLLRELIQREEFGRPVSVDAEEGGPYGWQLATLDMLTRGAGGGGVLIDIGSHVIDVILHVLDATPTLTRYEDNSAGGIETDCVLRAEIQRDGSRLSFPQSRPVPLRLELSRTRELRGSIRVECEHATLELMRANFTEVLIHRTGAQAGPNPIQFSAAWKGAGEFVGYEAFRREIDDWITAIDRTTEPVLSGRSVLPVVALIEEAYRTRVDLKEPEPRTPHSALRTPHPAPRTPHPAPRRVLITGAGGFLGGRVVDILRDHPEWEPIALVREPKSAARLARWPLDSVVIGDVTSRADMDRALAGCEAVVHCAVGTSWREDEVRKVTVDGTRTVAEAALAAGVKRFVHVSTLFVHKRDGVATVDESVPLEPAPGDSYGQNKLAAERALAAVAAKGLSTIVIRPTRIYGPFSRTFTLRPLQALTEGRLVIGGDAGVPANMVYVDNVVSAIVRALDAPASLGGSAYLINDAEQLSLGAFYEFFWRASDTTLRFDPAWRQHSNGSGSQSVVHEWLSALGGIAKSAELRGLVRKIVFTDPVGRLPRRLWEASPSVQQTLLKRFGADAAVIYRPAAEETAEDLVYYGEPATVSSAKAARDLGYAPVAPRADTMQWTLEWARYARVLPPGPRA